MSMVITPGNFGIVKSPPVQPPDVGLIASLAGTPYLLDDDGPMTEVGFDGTIIRGETRWEAGFQYLAEQQCYANAVFDPCNQAFVDNIQPSSVVQAMPFVCNAGDVCSSFGWEAHDFQGRAERALLAVESYQIAREFWAGTQSQESGWGNTYLASPANDVLATTAQAPNTALQLLEQALADTSNGQPGMIHCTRGLASAFSELGNTFRNNVSRQIQTYLGTTICPDAGYPGTGPSDHVLSDVQWAYATLMPTVRRSPIDIVPGTLAEALNRATNTITWRAEREAAVSCPPCTIIGVPVALPLPTIAS